MPRIELLKILSLSFEIIKFGMFFRKFTPWHILTRLITCDFILALSLAGAYESQQLFVCVSFGRFFGRFVS